MPEIRFPVLEKAFNVGLCYNHAAILCAY